LKRGFPQINADFYFYNLRKSAEIRVSMLIRLFSGFRRAFSTSILHRPVADGAFEEKKKRVFIFLFQLITSKRNLRHTNDSILLWTIINHLNYIS
jgi:hypothetical protein